jgi:hypothetical protein
MGRGKSDRQKKHEAYEKRLAASAINRQQREAERLASSWTSRLRFIDDNNKNGGATETEDTTAIAPPSSASSSSSFCTVVSWNILAENYCSPRSHRKLPLRAQKEVFDVKRRRRHWHRTLGLLVRSGGGQSQTQNGQTNGISRGPNDMGTNSTVLVEESTAAAAAADATTTNNHNHHDLVDVVCLQEVDQLVDVANCMAALGYGKYAASPTVKNGGKVDAVVIFVRHDHWKIEQEQLVRFDDLAHYREPQDDNDKNQSHGESIGENGITTTSSTTSYTSSRHLQGLQHGFLRKNVALLVRLRHKATGRTVVIANAHLYWNPSFEYVKVRTNTCVGEEEGRKTLEKERKEKMPHDLIRLFSVLTFRFVCCCWRRLFAL